jgi:hypothetical protein
VNWQQFKEALEEEGIDTTEAIHIAWALDGLHVQLIEVSTDNSAFSGWKLWKEENGKFGMEKIP